MRITTLALVSFLAVGAAAQDCNAETFSTTRQVDCAQAWMLNRAMKDGDVDTDVTAAYSLLRLALARDRDAGLISHDTYIRMDVVALEMFMTTVAHRRGHLVRKRVTP